MAERKTGRIAFRPARLNGNALGMQMASFGLRRLWADDDGMIQVELFASNGRQSTTQDFYTYPQDIEDLGRRLSEFFPRLGKGEIIFEHDAEGGSRHGFVSFKAFYISPHSIGILIQTNNNRVGYESATSRFCIIPVLSNSDGFFPVSDEFYRRTFLWD